MKIYKRSEWPPGRRSWMNMVADAFIAWLLIVLLNDESLFGRGLFAFRIVATVFLILVIINCYKGR